MGGDRDLNTTEIGDSGTEHLTNQKSLYLSGTKVTNAGLVRLKGLTKLRWLDLSRTEVTDDGLVSLKGLTMLQLLFLEDTKVTAAGVKKLKAALPKCDISWTPPKRR